MKSTLRIVFILLMSSTLMAQKEKVKGNKIVMTEQKIIESFTSIEVYDNFQITLQEDSDNIIKIEADSNVQEFIEYEIVEDVLKIKATRDIRRAKALNITIMYASELKSLKFYNEVQARSKAPIVGADLSIESYNATEVFLTVETKKLKGIANGKSTLELHSNTTESFYQVNEDAVLKGVITSDSLTIDLYQKGEAELEGEVKNILVRTGLDAEYYGQKLTTTTAKLIAEGNSESYIKTTGKITIEAIDNAEVYLLGEPKIQLDVFMNEATLYKKNLDYAPVRFKLN